jgi:hypothetical protein
MLITNFAAGELAETLFGRTDLGQYYSGVSRLENFDVIPTGGISRRHGMKRIPVRDTEGNPVTLGEGRIIPFIVDRENSFLLYLEPGSISILDSDGVLLDRKESVIYPVSDGDRYHVDNAFTREKTENTILADIQGQYLYDGAIAEVREDETRNFRTAKFKYYSSDGRWTPVEDFLLYSAGDIGQVQYAQNFQTMVLAHKSYPPLYARLYAGEITVNNFLLSFSVRVEKSDDIDEEPVETDRTYLDNGYLAAEDGYPGSVTFFNGRLVFAATGKSRQRIFASRVNDINRFSTYTLFLTGQKNYIVAKGSLNDENKKEIDLDITAGVLPFTESVENYYVDNAFFPDGTRVLEIKSNQIFVDKDSTQPTSLNPDDQGKLTTILNKWEEYKQNPYPPLDLVKLYKRGTEPSNSHTVKLVMTITVDTNITVTVSVVVVDLPSSTDVQGPWPKSVPDNAVKLLEEDGNFLNQFVDSIVYDMRVNAYKQGWQETEIYPANITNIKDELTTRVRATMKMTITGMKPIYDTAPNIDIRVTDILNGWRNIYIALYTKHVVEDRHPVPDDGFTFEIASDMSDAIKWLAQNKNLLAGTETGEWVIPAGVNATNVQAFLNSRYGSDSVQATSVGDAVCFFQTGRKALVEYYIPQQDTNFRANNMAMLSKNMLHESPAFDFDFISAPYTKIFVSREDGTVVCLLYERGTGTFAWGRITTNGLIKSVATIPGQAGYDDVYLIVQRGEAFFLERHSERVREAPDGDEAVFLDSYRQWDGDAADYGEDAVVYDETDNITYPVTREPIPEHVMWIGYPYASLVRSMPVLANDRMKQNNIKNLLVRFNDSFMPRVGSLSMEEGKERRGNTDSIGRPEPYSGVVRVPFPGVWDRDVFFELVHDRPTRCRVLAVNAEAN